MADPTPESGEKTDWHRLFGVYLMDLFTDSPFVVEPEKDLSVQQQFVDILIIRKRQGEFRGRLPDGLEGLAAHNVLTFKSFKETLDAWAMKELASHYVAYRKSLRVRGQPMLAETEFRLYAVCCQKPRALGQQVKLQPVSPGVYDCQWGTDVVRVIVTNQLPRSEPNAGLHLFAAAAESVRFGAKHFHQRSELTSSLLRQLFRGYVLEGLKMPFRLEDFDKEWLEKNKDWIVPKLTPEERVKGLTPEQRNAGLTPEQRNADLSLEDLERLVEARRAAEAAAPTKGKRASRASRRKDDK